MIFKEKCFSCYILLGDQVSLSEYLYFLNYWAICELQLFITANSTIHFRSSYIFGSVGIGGYLIVALFER